MGIKSGIIHIYNYFKVAFGKIPLCLKKVSYGSNTRIYGKILVSNHGKITIGNDFRCNSSQRSNPVGGPYQSVLYALNGAEIRIGNNVGISGTAIIARNLISIEDDVLIGSGTCIYDNDFHSLKYDSRNDVSQIKSAPVYIKKGAFIGARTIILKGVTIGNKSVIGAGSVVTKSIPDNQVWAGNPARYIKTIE